MKIFLDTANIGLIKKYWEMGIIDGVTTNPTLVAKEGKSFLEVEKEICSIIKGPVSAEVISLNTEGMVDEARNISKISENIVVKIPLIAAGLPAIKILSSEGIKTNATLCFSANQALLVAKAGATYVSPFVGRLDDIGNKGMEVAKDILQVMKNYSFNTQVIVSSIRHPQHILEAAKMGADIATVPPEVLEKLIKHPLTEIGLKKFLDDWRDAKLDIL